MILNKLSVLNYKNIRQADIVCSPKINCFFGNNGMGKTNLLDAIYYLSFCKSHVYTTEERLLRRGEDLCAQPKALPAAVGPHRTAAAGDDLAVGCGVDSRRERRAETVDGYDSLAI